MNIEFIKGSFKTNDAAELLTELFKTKIKCHEEKINCRELSEEDIKRRERRIIELQNELKAALEKLKHHPFSVDLQATVHIS